MGTYCQHNSPVPALEHITGTHFDNMPSLHIQLLRLSCIQVFGLFVNVMIMWVICHDQSWKQHHELLDLYIFP